MIAIQSTSGFDKRFAGVTVFDGDSAIVQFMRQEAEQAVLVGSAKDRPWFTDFPALV